MFRAPTHMEDLVLDDGRPVHRHIPYLWTYTPQAFPGAYSYFNEPGPYSVYFPQLHVPYNWNNHDGAGPFNYGPTPCMYMNPQSRNLVGYGNTNHIEDAKWFGTDHDPVRPYREVFEALRHRVLNFIPPVDFHRNALGYYPDIGNQSSRWDPAWYGPRGISVLASRPPDAEHIRMLHLDLNVELFAPRVNNTSCRATVFLLYSEARPGRVHLRRQILGDYPLAADPVPHWDMCKLPMPEDYNYNDVPNGLAIMDPGLADSRNKVTIVKTWDFIFPASRSVSHTPSVFDTAEGTVGAEPTEMVTNVAARTTTHGPYDMFNAEHAGPCTHIIKERIPLDLLASYETTPYTCQTDEDPPSIHSFTPMHMGLYDGMLSVVLVTNRRPTIDFAELNGLDYHPHLDFLNEQVTGDISWTIDYVVEDGKIVVHPADN